MNVRPSDLSLPPKFSAFRRGQLDIIVDIAASEKRFTLLSSPTGSGKSLIAASVAQLVRPGRTLYLTSTKGLQAQVTGDFSPIGAFDIRGQNNYRCLAVDRGGILESYGTPGAGCHDGPCHEGGKDICLLYEKGCTYYDAVRVAAKAPLVVTNYRYWMTLNRFSDPDTLGKFDLIVMDEAHDAPDELAEFCTIHLERADVKELLGLVLPPIDDGTEAWVEWATAAVLTARRRYATARAELTGGGDRRKALDALRRLRKLGRDLVELSKAHKWKDSEPASPDVFVPGGQTDWVTERTATGLQFSPVWAHAYAEDYLFRGVKRIVLVSATLQPTVATYLGIPPAESEFKEHASTFDPRKRPFIWVPTTRVDRAMTEGQVRVWVNKMDAIIDKRTSLKGIIHTRSYDRAAEIMRRSRHRDTLLMSHTRTNTREVVERFKKSVRPCVLVSPSVETGYDFPYDQCVALDTPILTGDFKWVPAGDIKTGDPIIGFDENQVGKVRRWSNATVTDTKVVKLPSYRLILEDGTEVISSSDHCWLSRRGHDTRWVKTKDIVTPDHPPFGGTKLYKLSDVWKSIPEREAGYLAGAFDGEGTLSGSRYLGFYQKDNSMLAEMIRLLKRNEFDFTHGSFTTKIERRYGPATVERLHIRGGVPMIMRFMGECRPARLVVRVEDFGAIRPKAVAVVHKEFLGDVPLATLNTTSRTYIAAGLASHNCRYQIIAKVPFADTRSEVLKARVKSDKRYNNYLTALSLIQMAGRGMRAEDDTCETFVVDDHWEWARPAFIKMGLFPKWFMASFKTVRGVP